VKDPSSNFKNWHSAPFSLLEFMWQTNYSKACQIIKLGTLLCAVLSLAINTMYLQEQTIINLYPLEATGPLADKTCQEISLWTEMKDVGLLVKHLPCLEIFLSLICTFESLHLFIFQSQGVRLYFLMKSGSVSHKAMYQLCQKPQCFSNSTI